MKSLACVLIGTALVWSGLAEVAVAEQLVPPI